MKDLEQKYSAEEIASAQAWVRNECGALSEEGFAKAVEQVLELRAQPARVVRLNGGPLNMYNGPIPKVELLDPEPAEEPLLTLDNVRQMPEMRKTDLSFEDRVTNRLMLAMARGEIVLELDGTPEGKARDAQVVKKYLTSNAGYYPYETRDQWLQATGGITADERGTLWFEYPDTNGLCMSDINPPRPTQADGEKVLQSLITRFPGSFSDTGVTVKVNPDHVILLDKPEFKEFRERHPDLHRGLPPGRTLKITPIKKDDK